MLSALVAQAAMLGWLAVAFVAAVIEVSVPHFGSVFVSAAAVAAAGAAFLGFGVSAQFLTFVIVLIISIVGLRSRLMDRYVSGRGVPGRTEALVGRHGVVTHEIDPTLGTGRVNVGGEDWAARSATIIEAGAKVQVVGSDGILLEVARI